MDIEEIVGFQPDFIFLLCLPLALLCKMPFTLPMPKTKAMVLVFGLSSLLCRFPKENVVSISAKKVVLVFGFSFCLRERVGVFLPPLRMVHQFPYFPLHSRGFFFRSKKARFVHSHFH